MKILCVIILSLFASDFTFAQKLKWLDGEWAGHGYQPATEGDWSMHLSANSLENFWWMDYKSQPCAGRWAFIKKRWSKYEFLETITEEPQNCEVSVKVIVEKNSDSKLTVTYFAPGSRIVMARGYLYKQ